MFTRSLVGPVLLLASACQASAGAQVQAKSNGQTESDANLSLASNASDSPTAGGAGSLSNKGFDDEPSDALPANPGAMLGARAGLRLYKTGEVTCQCLSVAVGDPKSSRFTWEGPTPITNPASQLVVGLSSEGINCPEAARDSLGASYHGYEVVGADVVVSIESARNGRPIVQGGVVPKPVSGGRIIIRPVDAKTPFGRSVDGKSMDCVVWTTRL